MQGSPSPPAVGGAVELNLDVHTYVRQHGEGVEFTLASLCEKNEDRWFVPAQNHAAITRRYELELEPQAWIPFSEGGWHLVDKLPDTNELSGS